MSLFWILLLTTTTSILFGECTRNNCNCHNNCYQEKGQCRDCTVYSAPLYLKSTTEMLSLTSDSETVSINLNSGSSTSNSDLYYSFCINHLHLLFVSPTTRQTSYPPSLLDSIISVALYLNDDSNSVFFQYTVDVTSIPLWDENNPSALQNINCNTNPTTCSLDAPPCQGFITCGSSCTTRPVTLLVSSSQSMTISPHLLVVNNTRLSIAITDISFSSSIKSKETLEKQQQQQWIQTQSLFKYLYVSYNLIKC